MRLAIFGGAFDPIHCAHVRVGCEAADRFGLDRVLIVPAARPPHKELHAPYEDRVRMAELAVVVDSRLQVSRVEQDALSGYSIDTILKVREGMDPGDDLFFIIGGDAFAEIRTWRRWREVLRLTRFIVVSRPGHEYKTPEGADAERLDTLALPVSSTDIRRRLASGERPEELPPAVLQYILQRGLYRHP